MVQMIMLLVVLLAALGAAAELAARVWFRRCSRDYVLRPNLRLRLHLDPEVFPQFERVVRFEVNSEGERGYEPPRSTDGLFRVLVVGGSQPEGYFLDQDTNWPGALQRLLDTPAHRRDLGASRVHVGCIARSGVGSEALDLILKRVLPHYRRLQAIVVLVGASDMLRWLEQGAPAAIPPVELSDVFRFRTDASFGWRPRQLALTEAVLRMRRRLLKPTQVHDRAGRWVARARATRAQAKVVRASTPDPAPMLNHFERHFRSALQRAQAHADRVLVARQSWFDKDHTPDELAQMWHGGIGQIWRQEITMFYSIDVTRRLMARVDAVAARVADELGIEHVDLRSVLEPSLRNYYDFFHLTPAGSRAVASAVGAAVLGHTVQHSTGSDSEAADRVRHAAV